MRKTATAKQDCQGREQARELLEECEASGQMTPAQAYQHWLAGEIGNQREGDQKVSGDDSIRLCPSCTGHCPSETYCHQQTAETDYYSLPALFVIGLIAVASFALAAYVGLPFSWPFN